MLGSLGGRAAAVLVLAGVAACTKDGAPAVATVKQRVEACQPDPTRVNSHLSHRFACASCHPCGGALAAGGTLPSGTPITGTITKGTSTTPTTCNVNCHGGQTVTWNQTSPVTCASCHQEELVGAARSGHVIGTDRTACTVCHDTSNHLSGTPKLVVGDGTPGNAACLACHSGAGKAIAGRAPPAIEFGAAGSDPHGDAGSEPARACLECHDPHQSTSTFLLGGNAGGTRLPEGAVATRTGAGAQALCSKCHPTRHASCGGDCHAHEGGVGHGPEPIPNGGACFSCHGHEGIVRGDERDPSEAGIVEWYGFFTAGGCKHCHNTNLPPTDTAPPDIITPKISNDGTTMTVAWTSSEPASSYVEYRTADAPNVTKVVGDPKFRLDHSVQIVGLSPAQALELRIRSSDRSRNVAFGTTEHVTMGGPSTPLTVKIVDFRTCTLTTPVQFSWRASTIPGGAPLAYELQVAVTQQFEPLAFGATTDLAATSQTASLQTPNAGRRYYWRVRAREPVSGLVSTWSSVETFYVRQDYDLCW